MIQVNHVSRLELFGGRKHVYRLVAYLFALTSIAGCAPAAAPVPIATPPQSAPKLSQDSVRAAAISSSWIVWMAPYIAQDKGFWAQEGLREVDLKVVAPPPAHLAGFIGGAFDFSLNLNTDNAIRINAQGEKVFAVAGSTNAPNYTLYAKGVTRLEDLRGKTIGTDSVSGSVELLTVDLLKLHGLQRTDVNLVPISGATEDLEQAVLNGTVSAALAPVADEPKMREGGAQAVGRVAELYPEYQFAVTAARGDIIDRHPDTVVAFLKGMCRGFAYIQDPANGAEILQILKNHGVTVDESKWSEMLALERPLLTRDGSLTLVGLGPVVDREKAAGRAPADFSADRLVRSGPLEQAQRDLGFKR
jgi:NitT/TauT family transport system substrate-binding protein